MRTPVPLTIAALVLASAACSGGGPGTTSTGTGTGANTSSIDGTWDITSTGGNTPGPSQMIISAGRASGTVVDSEEGTTNGGCTASKSRLEFVVEVHGNAVSGTFTRIEEWTGNRPGGGNCGSNYKSVSTLSGSRSTVGSGDLGGQWQLQADDAPLIKTVVEGLTAKAWDRLNPADGESPAMTIAVSGGLATASSPDRSVQFAARRR